ncbi:MAG TPA: hypothetical protein VGO37_01830 [Steroidobacteraceae bacterium]|jgi:hypothetical protein|nr:hypothetical protein [Steroidobacteraceae bacterium]
MKTPMVSIALAALVVIGAQALADDSSKTSKTSADKAQMMKDCMARQKATNSSMTQAAMETVCKNEIKGDGQKDGNDLATGPKPSTDK